uniref:Uncharacterized protein n=1 Tax=Spongospora subterranea TaxID=70186 RepID=A0A0H5QUK4_9EUKA|eukprot:CRZ05417.1 hypothetical protein [Spongospora subterranea]
MILDVRATWPGMRSICNKKAFHGLGIFVMQGTHESTTARQDEFAFIFLQKIANDLDSTKRKGCLLSTTNSTKDLAVPPSFHHPSPEDPPHYQLHPEYLGWNLLFCHFA